MGFEVGRSALDSLLHPEPVQATPVTLVILAAAIAVKLWMFWFNRALGRAIGSAAMEAAAADSCPTLPPPPSFCSPPFWDRW